MIVLRKLAIASSRTDLRYFGKITPTGFRASLVTSSIASASWIRCNA